MVYYIKLKYFNYCVVKSRKIRICEKIILNVSPIEVKLGKNYTYSSLNKFKAKYGKYLHTNYILHIDDLKEENEIVFLPIYMTGLL